MVGSWLGYGYLVGVLWGLAGWLLGLLCFDCGVLGLVLWLLCEFVVWGVVFAGIGALEVGCELVFTP